ncbi:hypothetical protein CEXT_611881 [Caerostris extrusa]|uniref:Uncharacterized protein n=1 Tax=Caerostris extrusa TaxID=172846 RepID=A0AAV4MN12_CAEEX|nr:hypothetical protein CEXT_611881 [Caerostris extrusa]
MDFTIWKQIIHQLLLQEDHKNDVCPNLTPAYSFETPITENNFNKHTHDNLTEIQESSLCVAEKGFYI